MNFFRFEIQTMSGASMTTRFSGTEEGGLRWCKKYIRAFRIDFPDAHLRIIVSERERTKNLWEASNKPYNYKKTLLSKPKKTEEIDHQNMQEQ